MRNSLVFFWAAMQMLGQNVFPPAGGSSSSPGGIEMVFNMCATAGCRPGGETSNFPRPVTTTRTMVACYAAAGVAPTGSPIIIDVLKNGVSIFSGSKPTVAVGSLASSSVSISVAIAPGDILIASVSQRDSDSIGQFVSTVCKA